MTLTASVTMGHLFLLSIVTGFHKTHPLVSSKLLLLDRVVNLVEEGIDVALRVGQLPDSSLISRHVGDVRRILVASPAYLAKRGAPRAPADLKVHSIIAFTGLMPNREWTFGAGRTAQRVALAPRLEINDGPAAIAAAEEGEGITIALLHMVAKQIKRGRLVHVLETSAPPPVPVQLIYPESRLVATKVRAFIDYAAPRLRAALHDVDSSVPHAVAETARTRRGRSLVADDEPVTSVAPAQPLDRRARSHPVALGADKQRQRHRWRKCVAELGGRLEPAQV